MATTSISETRYKNDDRRSIEIVCACGCGARIKEYTYSFSPSLNRYSVYKRRFVHGHNVFLINQIPGRKEKIAKTLKGHITLQETREKIRKTLKERWKYATNNKKRLNTKRWRDITILVYKRDKNTCQKCGILCKEREKQCHHIIPWKISHDDSLKNLITLCKSCHKKIEIELYERQRMDQ